MKIRVDTINYKNERSEVAYTNSYAIALLKKKILSQF